MLWKLISFVAVAMTLLQGKWLLFIVFGPCPNACQGEARPATHSITVAWAGPQGRRDHANLVERKPDFDWPEVFGKDGRPTLEDLVQCELCLESKVAK